uniref:DUF5899 domain-containing protein n=1 Tax=viral metagenome TaxID=1070528 RepID=A0A6C0HHJ1_9ZZZZ
MAEIAIPLLALGGMYIMSNQKGGSIHRKEGFTNMTPDRNALPGVNPPTPPINYPTTAAVNQSNVKYYPNANQATDKYYQKDLYKTVDQQNTNYGVGGSTKQSYSLTGEPIDKECFNHINMVPFFGAKIKGASTDFNVSETILDTLQGQGSQQYNKKEIAPLFQPQKNMQFANGAPNMSDFLQSRVNPSMRMANVKPWEEQKVAPGLNRGFGTDGSAGFNSGMEAREQWLPRTVDQLRVETNPKLSFELAGHQGPAIAYVQNSGSIQTQGKVEKNLPDTYYEVGPDRWFTTTGLEKAQTSRGIEMLQDVNRTSTTAEYFGAGAAKEGEATYVAGAYEPVKRTVLPLCQPALPNAAGRAQPTVADYGSQSYSNLPNNRATMRPQENLGIVSGIMKAVVSPILDVLRPSRKENVIGNLRPTGNINAAGKNGVIYNPADRTKTTIREMTEAKLDFNHLNVQGQGQDSNGYLVEEYQPVNLQRDSTNKSYSGNAGPSAMTAPMNYQSNYAQHNNVNKTSVNRPNQGGTQVFNQQDNISIHRRDCDRDNNRLWVRSPGSTHIATSTPSMESYGTVKIPQSRNTGIECERINPDILTAFKNNPYTQSLQSWA